MRERICDEWYALLFCANLLSMLVAAVTAAASASASTNTTADAGAAATDDEMVCPPMPNDGCSCYVFDGNVFVECPSATLQVLRKVLAAFVRVPIHSLSIYDLDRSVTTIGANDLGHPPPMLMRQLHISLSAIDHLDENSFRGVRDHLESLAIVSAHLKHVPQKTLPFMVALRELSFETNEIVELPEYGFYGLRLTRLNLKGNALCTVGENAFAGLESTLEEADLSANRLSHFPMLAVRRLRQLVTINLAWNEVRFIVDDGYTRLDSVHHLDLSSNKFASLSKDAFRPLPQLRTLRLYYNGIEGVHRQAFFLLHHLETLDLSHNAIGHLDAEVFAGNTHLRTIDLSHNHLHQIDGLFANLQHLIDVFLAENNILEVPVNAFANATALDIVYLQRNAIRHVQTDAFSALSTIRQLRMSENFIENFAWHMLVTCANLTTFDLDHNSVVNLEPGMFAGAKNLRELRLNNNRVAAIKVGVFQPLPHLIELHLQNNVITAIEPHAFHELRNLRYVNLAGNALRVLSNVFSPDTSSLVSVLLESNALQQVTNDAFASLSNVETLWLAHNRIIQLSGDVLKHLRQIQRLYVADNTVSVIEEGTFSAMSWSLQLLDLSANKLNAIEETTFGTLEALEKLYLMRNHICAIHSRSFVGLPKLHTLDLSDNHLVKFSLLFHENVPLESLRLRNCSMATLPETVWSTLRQLVQLDLRSNLLTDDQVEKLESQNLRILDLRQNNLTSLTDRSLRGIPALGELRVDQNHIVRLDIETFAHTIHLRIFSAAYNNLYALPAQLFRTTHQLRELTLDANQLTTFPCPAVCRLYSLQQLSAAHNKIRHIDLSMLAILRDLIRLNLSQNAIDSIGGYPRANFSRLTIVDLAGNRLSTLPVDWLGSATSLRHLDLSANRFHRLPPSFASPKNTPALETLIFDNNPIERLANIDDPSLIRLANTTSSSSFSASTSTRQHRYPVRVLHVSATKLFMVTATDLQPFDQLTHLCLARNAIAHIAAGAFSQLPNLLSLDLSRNHIGPSWLPQRLRGLYHLKILNLTQNRIELLEQFVDDLHALETLDLSHNRIEYVGADTLRQLTSLAELHLRGNRISVFADDLFEPLRTLHILDVTLNNLRSLPLNAFRTLETRLTMLKVKENPVYCDCDQQETWQWLRDHEKMMTGDAGTEDQQDGPEQALRCDGPLELRGRPFLQLRPTDFCATPLLVRLDVRDVRPHSVNVSWRCASTADEETERRSCAAADVTARVVRYQTLDAAHPHYQHRLDTSNETYGKEDVNRESVDVGIEGDEEGAGVSRSVRFTQLAAGTRYTICVTSSGSGKTDDDGNDGNDGDHTTDETRRRTRSAAPQRWSRCVRVRTLDAPGDYGVSGESAGGGDKDGDGSEGSLLTRRLGLMVGGGMGCVVFVVLVAVLVYTKVRKQRRNVRNQQPLPPEYLSYRHFSLPPPADGTSNATPAPHPHPIAAATAAMSALAF